MSVYEIVCYSFSPFGFLSLANSFSLFIHQQLQWPEMRKLHFYCIDDKMKNFVLMRRNVRRECKLHTITENQRSQITATTTSTD